MKITFNEARKLAEKYYNDDFIIEDDVLVILDEYTVEKDYGWYFHSQSKKYLADGNYRNMAIGNGMVLVRKDTGELIEFGTALETEEYIKQYELKNGS